MYGGYDNLTGGKVSYALADLTGGFPQLERLEDYRNTQIDILWKLMQNCSDQGALMGAGSPDGNDTEAVDGILKGHAYSIHCVQQADGIRLIKLRNPHGTKEKTVRGQTTEAGKKANAVVEWEGDWGDDSDKWNERYLQKFDM